MKRLTIINAMLRSVGISAVTNPNSLHPDAVDCNSMIDQYLEELQAMPLYFNRERGLVLQPNPAGEVLLPSNAQAVDPVDRNAVYVLRSGKLYDPVNHTFQIGKPVAVDLLLALPVEDLPPVAAMYLRAQCVAMFYLETEGEDNRYVVYSREVIKWEGRLKQLSVANTDVSLFRRPIVAQMLRGTHYNQRVAVRGLVEVPE